MKTQENADRFSQFLKDNEGIRLEIKPLTPESNRQRGYYHGGVISMWVYLDGNDYKDSQKLNQYHEVAKRKFNGDVIFVHGKLERVGQSTKGQLTRIIDEVIDYLEENYGIDRSKVLDPEHYKDFIDRVYMHGEFDTYIDYLKSLNRLK